jgi:hypothetical protein
MMPTFPIVFLVDVDNTLLDNDRIQQDLKDHIERVFGRPARERYWRILEDLFAELGYRALRRCSQGASEPVDFTSVEIRRRSRLSGGRSINRFGPTFAG